MCEANEVGSAIEICTTWTARCPRCRDFGCQRADLELKALDVAQFHRYCVAMKNITISVDESVYRLARKKAAAEDTSLSRVVQHFLTQWAGQDDRAALQARLEKLFAEADVRDRDKEGSAGPFSREELYAERLERFR